MQGVPNQNNVLVVPDEPTKNRIKNLAIVGKALNDTYSEENQDYATDFFLAKEALAKFAEGIEAMQLDEPSKNGMRALIKYLEGKIDKRMAATSDNDIEVA